MNPIDVIANAIRIADGNHSMGAGQLAEVVAAALTDELVVANAMAAVRAHSWTAEDVEEIPNRQLHAIVRIVLSSVGGA
jgi:hypothetical protein